jgi:hypothetical protein
LILVGGNGGAQGSHTVGAPSTNKNGVCVGASLSDIESTLQAWDYFGTTFTHDENAFSDDYVAGFSAQGPTSDGRLKPDIHAPGKHKRVEIFANYLNCDVIDSANFYSIFYRLVYICCQG